MFTCEHCFSGGGLERSKTSSLALANNFLHSVPNNQAPRHEKAALWAFPLCGAVHRYTEARRSAMVGKSMVGIDLVLVVLRSRTFLCF